MSTWKVRHQYVRAGRNDEITLPSGWEPLGGEVREGGGMDLILGRKLSEEEEIAHYAAQQARAAERAPWDLTK